MEVLLPIILIVVAILIGRLFGAWMLRINEVINLQKEIDAYIYTLYEFNNEEVKFIESQ